MCVLAETEALFFKGVASDGIHNCGRKEVETSFFRIQQNVYAKIQYKTDKASRYFTVRIKEILLVYSEKGMSENFNSKEGGQHCNLSISTCIPGLFINSRISISSQGGKKHKKEPLKCCYTRETLCTIDDGDQG